jgi:carboxyl-terminal processing protease
MKAMKALYIPRILIKGFLVLTLTGAAFLTGFHGPNALSTVVPKNWGTVESTPVRIATNIQRQWSGPSVSLGAVAYAQDTNKPLIPGETYSQVLSTVLSDYATPPTKSKDPKEKGWKWTNALTEAAISGMLGSIGDRYTEYWNHAEFEDNTQDNKGSFGGVGASLLVDKDKKIVVAEPMPNTPALRAGILSGDVITHVNGKSVTGKKLSEEVIPQIKGDPGTFVDLTIERAAKPKPKILTFHLRREIIHSPITESRMQDPVNKIGYIRLYQFNEEADIQIGQEIEKLKKQGMKALVFDLRSNPGGILEISRDIASRFIPYGPVVWLEQKSGQLESLNVENHNVKRDGGQFPLVVLVNGGSASASEIVSGGLQDAKVATVVGTRTFGKGLVQKIIPISDSLGRVAAVKVTIQRYLTRNKRDINMKRDEDDAPISQTGGIMPDFVIEPTPKDFEAQQKYFMEHPQMRKALEVLRGKLKK